MTTLVDPKRFLEYAQTLQAMPYVYGKKGPLCFDCSGLVTYSLWKVGGPDWRYTHNAQDLADVLKPVIRPDAAAILLAVYGLDDEHVDHVMITVGDGRVYGACGGGPECKTLDLAFRLGARVQFRSRPDYRQPPHGSPLIGFRALELVDEAIKPA
jgi:hypothetical protein